MSVTEQPEHSIDHSIQGEKSMMRIPESAEQAAQWAKATFDAAKNLEVNPSGEREYCCIDEGCSHQGTELVASPSGVFMTDVVNHGRTLSELQHIVTELGVTKLNWHPGCGAADFTLGNLKGEQNAANRQAVVDQGIFTAEELDAIINAPDLNTFARMWAEAIAAKLGLKVGESKIVRSQATGHAMHYGHGALVIMKEGHNASDAFDGDGHYHVHAEPVSGDTKVEGVAMWNAALAGVVADGGHSEFAATGKPFYVTVVSDETGKQEQWQAEVTKAWVSLGKPEEKAPVVIVVNPDKTDAQ